MTKKCFFLSDCHKLQTSVSECPNLCAPSLSGLTGAAQTPATWGWRPQRGKGSEGNLGKGGVGGGWGGWWDCGSIRWVLLKSVWMSGDGGHSTNRGQRWTQYRPLGAQRSDSQGRWRVAQQGSGGMGGQIPAGGWGKRARRGWRWSGCKLRKGGPGPRRKRQSGGALEERVQLTGTVAEVGHKACADGVWGFNPLQRAEVSHHLSNTLPKAQSPVVHCQSTSIKVA